MKKYFIIALAAFGFAACAEKINGGVSPEQTGELEQSYIAVNLMSSELGTRADDQAPTLGDGDLADGIADEHAVKTVHFFFFRQGAPFAVNAFPGTAPGGTKNWQQATGVSFKDDLDNENISKESNILLVLNNYKGQYPDQIVAVINWNPEKDDFYTLEELEETLSELQVNGNGFVMSNSVYRSGEGKVINATDISGTYDSAAKAEAAPVNIYVERIAAKVTVNTPTADIAGKWDATNKRFDTGKSGDFITLNDDKKVYVQIKNWSLYNARTQSNLIKSIDPTWTDDALGLNWNDSPRFRSYWADADTYTGKCINDNQFNWSTGYDLGKAEYCGENTTENISDRTKLILKGQLVDANNKAVVLVKWNGQEFVGIDNLKQNVVAQLQYLVYSYTYTSEADQSTYTYSPITVADIECVSGADAPSAYGIAKYAVYFKLSDVGEGKNWAVKSGDKWDKKEDSQINTYLVENIPAATVYADGQTYYYIDIKHLGTSGKEAEYGIVRNHIYDIEIQSIKGYGTPVFIPGGNILVPETPIEEEGVYVAAKINVLSWRVVKQGVNIEVQ